MMQKQKWNLSFDPALKYKLNANPKYLVDRPIMIKFTLQNCTDEHLWVLTWYTPLEGLKGKIFLVICNGKEIPYEGPMVKRGDPVRNDYVHIGPMESVSAEIDLSRAYNLPLANECRVQFKGRIYDVVNNEENLPRRRDEHQGVDISGNAVAFRIISPIS